MTIHEGSNDWTADLKPPGGTEQRCDEPPLGHEETLTQGEALADEEALCGEEEFAEVVRELVTDQAPQLFALVQEFGERADGWIVAWGMAFDDHVEVVSANGRLHASLTSAERAQWAFSRRRKIRLVWTEPATTRRPEQVACSGPHSGAVNR